MAIEGDSCSRKSLIVNPWWRIIRKTAYSTFKRQKNTHTPTTVAFRDGNSHITLEIKHFRHQSEGNISSPPPASSSVKTTRTTNQYPKTGEWFEPYNKETRVSPPLHQGRNAIVNTFRNTVNNVRKLSTSPVRRVTPSSGSEVATEWEQPCFNVKKLSTKIRKRKVSDLRLCLS